MAGEKRFLVADFLMSFMWVWSSVIIKILVHSILGYGFHDVQGELIRYGISVANMFLFALLAKLTILSTFCLLLFLVIFNNFLFTLGPRIPAKVMGWAFANGEHITKEHLIVYWHAPVEATLAAGWVFGLLVQPKKDNVSSSTKD